MLRKRVSSLDDVPEKFRGLYAEGEDGIFTLDEEFEIDDSGLKKNADKLLAEKKALAQQKLDLEERLNALELQNRRADEQSLAEKGEYEKLLAIKEQQFQAQLEAANKKAEKALESLRSTLVNAELTKLATELAGDRADLIKPHLKDRIDVTEGDSGEFKVVYKDSNGNVSSSTSALLIEEFKSNALFEPILKGRQSSGGGAGGGAGAGGQSSMSEWEGAFTPGHKEYSPMRQSELQAIDEKLYQQLSDKHGLNNPYVVNIPQGVGARVIR